MIISHKFKFIFIKTRKTAGTSIEVFLSALCGPEDVFTPIDPHVDPHVPRNFDDYYNHVPGHIVRSKVGPDVWRSYFKFCVERNPWDKALSHFHMIKARSNGALTFDEYLKKGYFPIDLPKYTEPSDPTAVIVDRVLRYECLSEELARVFGPLNVPFDGTLGVAAKAGYRTDRRPYREIYSQEQAELIEKAFAREILLHGYSF